MKLTGNIVNIHEKRIFSAEIVIHDNIIVSINPTNEKVDTFILPGLIDSHVHIESSMLIPSRFAELVVPRGTVGVVSDPHEIANVMGVRGVEYMVDDAANVPLKCFFGVPSCVPATSFETSGSVIGSDDVEYLFNKGALFLAEMMNFPGVIHGDQEVHRKLEIAKKHNALIHGHSPGILG
jgi:adenine deaminase